jgi:uncharacterized FAD-dependent dehydrogenase
MIVGAGPAGYFAALECLKWGIKPVLFEQGKDVQSRRRDLKLIQQDGIVNPESNYCFGEGGAGTYSDGKLYTRAKKRGNIRSLFSELVEHGANPDILIEAHPHIGSNKLPHIIANIRATIQKFGGEIHFNSEVTDLLMHDNRIAGVVINEDNEYLGKHLILATGHSSRKIYHLLHRHKIGLESKPFALGVRIEHPQQIIDAAQYRQKIRSPHLPPASYNVSFTNKNTGIFSFCMCPGGLIVPAATAPGEIVVNGMSLSRRDSPYANAGMVVSVKDINLKKMGYQGVFGGLKFQQETEQTLFNLGDGSQKAPAQRAKDFISGQNSKTLPSSSYIPGIYSSALDKYLPKFISYHLKLGLIKFAERIPQFLHEEAVLVGAESRTSSPIRIPRSPKTLMHPEVAGLYPCGEGAGYAGGIVSAALDGQRVVRSILNSIKG